MATSASALSHCSKKYAEQIARDDVVRVIWNPAPGKLMHLMIYDTFVRMHREMRNKLCCCSTCQLCVYAAVVLILDCRAIAHASTYDTFRHTHLHAPQPVSTMLCFYVIIDMSLCVRT